jgi:hypothetical protein
MQHLRRSIKRVNRYLWWTNVREKSTDLECIAVKAEKDLKFLLVTVDFKKWFQFF